MDRSALVKLGTPARTGGYLGIPPEAKEQIGVTRDSMGVLLPAGRITRVGSKDDGMVIEDGVVTAGQTALVRPFAELQPNRFQIIVSFNPELLRYGLVSCPTLVQPTSPENIILTFQAKKNINLYDLDYVFSLYMLD